MTTENKASYIKILVIVAIMFGFKYIPPFGGITQQGMAVLGIMIGLILGWSSDPKCMTWASLLGIAAMSFAGSGTMAENLTRAIGQVNIAFLFVVMLIMGALADAQVDLYLIQKIMGIKRAQGRPWVMTALLVIAPLVLGNFINTIALILFLLPLYGKLFKQVGYAPGDKYVIHTYLGMMISAISASFLFPFKGLAISNGALVEGYLKTIWTNVGFMLTITPWMILLSCGYVLFMRIIGCDVSKIANADMKIFGDGTLSLTKHQQWVFNAMLIYIIGCLVITFGGMMSNPIGAFLTKVGVYGWALILAAGMMIIKIDGKRLLEVKTAAVNGISWDTIWLIASATLVANALTAEGTGIGPLMYQITAPLLSNLSPAMFLIALSVLVLLGTNFLNNLAVKMIALTICGTLLAGGLAVNGAAVGGAILGVFTLGFLLPSSSMFGAFLHTADLVTPVAIYKNVLLTLIWVILTVCLIYVPLCAVIY